MAVYAIKKCDNCGKDVEICHRKRLNHKNIFCSIQCAGEYKRKQRGDDWYNCTCPICGKKFHLKPYALKKAKHQPVCSYECLAEYRKTIYLGENNPNYDHHALQKYKVGDTKISNYGYILEYVGKEFYKFGKTNENGFEFQHKLVAEKYLANETNSDYVEGLGWVLRKEFVVHHKDGNKQNNNVDNLQIMTRSDHTKLHNPKQNKPKVHKPRKKHYNCGKDNARSIKVYCIELDMYFDTITEAEGYIRQGNVKACIQGRTKTAGKHPITGEKLHWQTV